MDNALAARLLDRAEALTLKRLKREGELMPGVLLYSKARGSVVIPLPWESAEHKLLMLDLLRAKMADAGVEAYAIWSECWMSQRPTHDRSADVGALTEVMPRNDPNRLDAVVIVAAEKGKQAAVRVWEVKKDGSGRVTKLEPVISSPDEPDHLGAGLLGELLAPPRFDA
jgi:hypothetical protein